MVPFVARAVVVLTVASCANTSYMTTEEIGTVLAAWKYDARKDVDFLQKITNESQPIEEKLRQIVWGYQGKKDAQKIFLIGIGGNGGPMLKTIQMMISKGYSNFQVFLVLDYTADTFEIANTWASYKICTQILQDLARYERHNVTIKLFNGHLNNVGDFPDNAKQLEKKYLESWDKHEDGTLLLETVNALPAIGGKTVVVDAITGTGMKDDVKLNPNLSVNLALIQEIPKLMKNKNNVLLISNDCPSGQFQDGKWHTVLVNLKVEYTPHVILSMHWHKELVKTHPGAKIYLMRATFYKKNPDDGSTTQFVFSETALAMMKKKELPQDRVESLLPELEDVGNNHSDKNWLRYFHSPGHESVA